MKTYSYLLYCANGRGRQPCPLPLAEDVGVKTEENGYQIWSQHQNETAKMITRYA